MPKDKSRAHEEQRTSLFPPMTSANKNRAAWVSIALTSVGMLVAAILYVTSALASTEDRAYQADRTVETRVKKHVEEDYVKKVEYVKDITVLDERQQQIKKDVTEVKSMIKDIHNTMRQNNQRRWRPVGGDDVR